MMINYVSVLRPYSLEQCYKWYKSLLIHRSGYLRMPVIRSSTHLNGDSLSDRYDLRMPIYGCADKLPSRFPSLKSVEKKQQQKTTTTTTKSNNSNNHEGGDVPLR